MWSQKEWEVKRESKGSIAWETGRMTWDYHNSTRLLWALRMGRHGLPETSNPVEGGPS